MKQETVIAHCLLSIIAVGSVMPSVRKNVISAATPAEAVLTDRFLLAKKRRQPPNYFGVFAAAPRIRPQETLEKPQKTLITQFAVK